MAAAFVGGALSAVQSRMNGQLAIHTGDGLAAAVFSFGSGLLVLSVMVLARKSLRDGLVRIAGSVRTGELRWWQLCGGLLGGYFVAVQSATVPAVGVAIFLVAVVAGQSSTSLAVDRIGLGPAGPQLITPARVVSALLAIVAVGVAVSDRLVSGTLSLGAIVFAVSAGIAIATQAAVNGRVATVARNPMSATFVNFLLGFAGLTLTFVVVRFMAGPDGGSLLGAPVWAYGGGVVGIVFIGIAVWAVPIVGVLVFAVTTIAGQLFGALVLDIVAPTPGVSIAWNLLAGVALAFVAAYVAGRWPRALR